MLHKKRAPEGALEGADLSEARSGDFIANASCSQLNYALRYADLGLRVLPLHWITDAGACSCGKADCGSPGKHPRAELASHGSKDSTTNPDTIKRWWTRCPRANIGVTLEGLLAIDVDPRNGGDVTLADLTAQHGPLADTACAFTGGGGEHHVYRVPDGVSVSGKLGKGIDLKHGPDQYIAVEPSNHISGKCYFWEGSSDPLEGQDFAPLPAWLVKEVTTPKQKAQEHANGPPTPKGKATGIITPERAAEIRSALEHLDPDPRDVWLNVGMALHSTDAPEARAIWDDWSMGSPKFDRRTQTRTWNSFDSGKADGIHIESLFHWAKEAGWRAAPPKQSGFRISPVSELLAEQPRTHWLVRGYLEADALACFYGPPGVGKSFVALDLAASIATGTDWHGQRVAQGPVIVLAGEGQRGIARRLKAWEIERGCDLSTAPLFVSSGPFGITDPGEYAIALEAIKKAAGETRVALTVVDTLARHFGGGDENSTRDMSAVIAAADRLRAEVGGSLALVHHTGHLEQQRERGSIALRGALDWSYLIAGQDLALSLTCSKHKDQAEPPTRTFDMVKVELPWTDEDGEPETSLVLRPATASPAEQAALGGNQLVVLTKLRDLTARADAVTAGPVRLDELRSACGLHRSRWREALNSLTDRQQIHLEGDFVRLAA